ncbi:MAG TPA: RodZ domain-containing protein [Rudaea sp.]|nr:RodZ domain-containing protein [Rudaea sp.]
MNTQQNGSNQERHDALDLRSSQSADDYVLPTESTALADDRLAEELPGESADTATEMRVDVIDMQESLGQRLRAAREVQGITREDAAARTKMRVAIIDSLERDEFDRIGHGVYLRGYLTKYLGFLGLPLVLADRVLEQRSELPPLVTSGTISRPRYLFERYSGSALYLVLTGVIIVPAVLLAMRAGFDSNLVRVAPLDATESTQSIARNDSPPSTSPTSAPTDASVAAQNTKTAAEDRPLAASMTPFPPTETTAVETPKLIDDALVPPGQHSLKITFTEASWVDIATPDGHKLEQGIIPAGSTRTYYSEQTLDAHLGNVNGATVEVDGKVQDLTTFRHSNVAHFKLAAGESTLSHSGG